MRSPTHCRRLAIVGRGRLGTALAIALREAGHQVTGPLARTYSPADVQGAELVLLCVPDAEISAAAAVLAERCAAGAGRPVFGHCSGATSLDALGAGESLSLHPLMTVAGHDPVAAFGGAGAAIAGSSERARSLAAELARDLGLAPFPIAEHDRAAYHAAASIASNFLIALEEAAGRLAESAGAGRELLVPLVRQSVENWATAGAGALTGPIARGDEATVARQRAAVAERAPELLELFDALARATRRLAGAAPPIPAQPVAG